MIDERRMLLIKEVGDLVTQKEELRRTLIERDAEIAKLRKKIESLQAWTNQAEEMLEQYRDEASTHTRMAEIAKVINSVPA